MLCRSQLLPIALLLLAHTKTLEKMDGTRIKERFLLFLQRCILRNTVDLLHFMLHRVPSVTSLKNVCCHNATPHTLRDELMCGGFQLYIWRLNPKHALSFNCPLWKKLALRLTENIIIQSEPEKQDKNQISEKTTHLLSDFKLKFFNASDFETKIAQRIRFWVESLTTRQILDWKTHNVLDFELKIFQHVRLWKKCLHPKSHVLVLFTYWTRQF